MASWILILVPIAAALAHARSLIAGRRGDSTLHKFAFYSGLLGLVILPAIPAVFFIAMPLPVVGSASPGMESIFVALLVSSALLFISSIVLSLSIVFSRSHKES